MLPRSLITGTLAGGLVLSVLNWVTAAILPPRYNQFRDPHAVVEAIRANVSGNDIYTAPQGFSYPSRCNPGAGALVLVSPASLLSSLR
jgi:hypothetical protein